MVKILISLELAKTISFLDGHFLTATPISQYIEFNFRSDVEVLDVGSRNRIILEWRFLAFLVDFEVNMLKMVFGASKIYSND